MSHPLFEIVTTTTGAISIRNKAVNEIMHNPVGPWLEANSLYVEQSNLKNRLLQSNGEFVLFDVGLGAAANALAALTCAQLYLPKSSSFRIVSFERDLELLKFAVEHAAQFTHFRGFEKAIEMILSQGEWSDNGISWQLRRGEFIETIKAEKFQPHIVFYDPYSPEVNKDMWTTEVFQCLREKSRAGKVAGFTSLYTYSQATKIRAALIAAGFYVGYGDSTGLKKDTTEAATSLDLLKRPLNQDWFERWKKSHVRYPYDCKPTDELGFEKILQNYFYPKLHIV